jgi:hypothetical protein
VRGVGLAVAPLLTVAMAIGSNPAVGSDTSVTNAVESLAADLAVQPASEAADLYKFLYQAIFGPGHAITDRAAAVKSLEDEIDGLGPPMPGEEPCLTLGGVPILVRVHLRPFVAAGGDPEALIDAFVATPAEVHGSPDQMTEAISLVVKWLHSSGQKELATQLEQLGRNLAAEGYPMTHHSPVYIEAYQPAYRVVAADLAAEHGWCTLPVETFER